MNALKTIGQLVAGALVLVTLQGCTAEDPALARDEALTIIRDSVRSGNAEEFCLALSALLSEPCSEAILSTAGIKDADFQSFAISETEEIFSMSAPNFELEIRASLAEQDNVEQWFLSLGALELPEYLLPTAGVIDGSRLAEGEKSFAMPSDEAPSIVFEPRDTNVQVSLIPRPWENTLRYDVSFDNSAANVLRDEAIRRCEAAVNTMTYEMFRSGFSDKFFQVTNPKFPMLREDRILTRFRDGTMFEGDSRRINYPRNLAFEGCSVAQPVRSESGIRAVWSTPVTFEGIVGEIDTSRPYYTGVEIQHTFSSVVSGALEMSLNEREMSTSISVTEEPEAKIPLEVISE